MGQDFILSLQCDVRNMTSNASVCHIEDIKPDPLTSACMRACDLIIYNHTFVRCLCYDLFMADNRDETYPHTFQPWTGPAILLVDLDAFFASVEQLDHPEWRGKPVIVGGDPDKHGVVSTCSYEAREYGVRSAMPSSRAKQLCPDAIWTNGHFSRYREMSRAIMQIIRDETPHVQQVSIDEAFADITPTRSNREHPVSVAMRIQDRVSALGVTCSIGLGVSKSVAKIASDMDKPRGLTIVYPGREADFLESLPIRRLSGVGPVAEEQLLKRKIFTLGDLARAQSADLEKAFGKNAEMMRSRALGRDASEIDAHDEIKSVSHEMTFAHDLTRQDDVHSALVSLLTKIGRRLRSKGIKGKTLHIKVRFDDRTVHTAQMQLAESSDDDIAMVPCALELLDKVWRPGIKLRLLGVGLSGFTATDDAQATLFDMGSLEDAKMDARKPLIEDKGKRKQLLDATDILKDKFGESAVVMGSEFKTKGKGTGSSSKNPSDYK